MERIGADVRRELERFSGSPGLEPIVSAWPSAVGPDISANAWPARLLRDGSLRVHARDAVWAFELTQRSEEIRSRLGVARVEFRVGELPAARSRGAAPEVSRRPRAATGPEAAAAASWTATIEDPELREAVARAARASLANVPSDRSF
jgi:hypothetical protein